MPGPVVISTVVQAFRSNGSNSLFRGGEGKCSKARGRVSGEEADLLPSGMGCVGLCPEARWEEQDLTPPLLPWERAPKVVTKLWPGKRKLGRQKWGWRVGSGQRGIQSILGK